MTEIREKNNIMEDKVTKYSNTCQILGIKMGKSSNNDHNCPVCEKIIFRLSSDLEDMIKLMENYQH